MIPIAFLLMMNSHETQVYRLVELRVETAALYTSIAFCGQAADTAKQGSVI
jgi:hypothetical protein